MIHVWSLMLVLSAAGEPAGAPARMAVMPLEARGLDERLARAATDILAGELVAARRWAVVTQEEIVALLGVEATRQALGCSDLACAVELGGALDAQLLVTGNATRLDDEMSLKLSVFDTRELRVTGMVRRTVPASEARLEQGVLAAARELIALLDAPDAPWTGREVATVSLFSLAGGALVGALAGGVVALRARGSLADGGLFAAEIDRLERRRKLGAIVAASGAVVALAAGGVATWLVLSPSATEVEAVTVAPWFGAGAGGLAASVRW